MKNEFKGSERRQFARLDYATPLAYKICKKETLSKLLQGYTSNVSESGLLCNMKDKVKKDDVLWLLFDRDVLNTCTGLEKASLIYQGGVVGRVVRVEHKKNNTYEIGIRFITREEKNLTNIYSKVHFIENQYENK